MSLSRSIFLKFLPKSVPPGSLLKTTDLPSFSNHSFNNFDWVDLPEPSPPSKDIKSPSVFGEVIEPSSPLNALTTSLQN